MGALERLMGMPESPAIEDRRNNQVGLLGLLSHLMASQKYQMDPLHTPIASGLSADAGANDLYGVGQPNFLAMRPDQQARFDAGKTPGELDFLLHPGQIVYPPRR